jgi:succinate dehydrogenase/fumarate reductase flavoprotein subunit
MDPIDVDVVVVGSGAAGLSAALAARAEGARVLVAESESVIGGATRLSGGWVMAAQTDVQRAAHIEDDASALYHEYLFINQFETQPGLARRLAYDSGSVIAWLTDMGVRFLPDVVRGGPELVPRTHTPEGGGQRIVDVLYQRCRQQDVDFALGNRVDRLIVRESRVAGVAVAGDELGAGAVVLATGGFGANPSLIAEHLPGLASTGDWRFYIGPESSRGDALALAAQVGARTVGHDRFVSLLAPRVEARDFDAYLPTWMLLLGPDGHRLLDETGPYGVTCGLAVAAGGRVYGLFDEQILADNGTPELPTFKPHGSSQPQPPNVWGTDGIRRLVTTGAIVQSETLEELADKLGIPGPAVIGSVNRYNESAAMGYDRDFAKDAKFLRPLEKPPFYGVEIRPAALGLTCFGIQIEESGHVVSENASTIEGLFAAGECTGGIIGSRYLSSGNSLANCLVFGRRAGRSAARHALAPTGHSDG